MTVTSGQFQSGERPSSPLWHEDLAKVADSVLENEHESSSPRVEKQAQVPGLLSPEY